MRKLSPASLFCASILGGAGCMATTQAATTTPQAAAQAAPAPEMEPLRYFVGTWRGEGAAPDGNKVSIEYKVESVLGGAWNTGIGELQPTGVHLQDYWGYVPAEKAYLRIMVNNKGQYSTLRSAGWNGEVLTWDGQGVTAEGEVGLREIIEKVAPDRIRATWQMKTKDGDWTTTAIENLRKN
jgi:hypothetical protein